MLSGLHHYFDMPCRLPCTCALHPITPRLQAEWSVLLRVNVARSTLLRIHAFWSALHGYRYTFIGLPCYGSTLSGLSSTARLWMVLHDVRFVRLWLHVFWFARGFIHDHWLSKIWRCFTKFKNTGIAQLVQLLNTGEKIGWSGFESRRGLGIFLFHAMSKLALGLTQPPIQSVPGTLSLEVSGRRVKLTI
jgi:hypothetical protein